MQKPAAFVEVALEYAEHSWHVVPYHYALGGACSCKSKQCRAPGAHPRFQNVPLEASNDERTIRTWGDLWEHSNVGVMTGARSNLVVLEVEPRLGGDEALAEYAPLLTDTLTAEKPGYVRRYFYRYPSVALEPVTEIARGLRLLADGESVPLPRYPQGYRGPNTGIYDWHILGANHCEALPVDFLEAIGYDLHSHYPKLEAREDVGLSFHHYGSASTTLEDLALVRWVAEPWVAQQSLTLLESSRPDAASELLAAFTATILEGRPFAGYDTKGGPVVYLTRKSPAAFARQLRPYALSGKAADRLSVLYTHALPHTSWDQILQTTVHRAVCQGARVVVIDNLESFTALANPSITLREAAAIKPLTQALYADLAIVAACTSPGGAAMADLGIAQKLQAPPALVSIADIACSVEPTSVRGHLSVRAAAAIAGSKPSGVFELKDSRIVRVDDRALRPAAGDGRAAGPPLDREAVAGGLRRVQ